MPGEHPSQSVITETRQVVHLVAAAEVMRQPSLALAEAAPKAVGSVFFDAGLTAGILAVLELLPNHPAPDAAGQGKVGLLPEQYLRLQQLCKAGLDNVTSVLQAIAAARQQIEQQQQQEWSRCSPVIH